MSTVRRRSTGAFVKIRRIYEQLVKLLILYEGPTTSVIDRGADIVIFPTTYIFNGRIICVLT